MLYQGENSDILINEKVIITSKSIFYKAETVAIVLPCDPYTAKSAIITDLL